MIHAAYHAIRAAKLRHTVGRWAARRYVQKRGINMTIYRLACQLEAIERGERV